jgi:hypothetical protein
MEELIESLLAEIELGRKQLAEVTDLQKLQELIDKETETYRKLRGIVLTGENELRLQACKTEYFQYLREARKQLDTLSGFDKHPVAHLVTTGF